MEHTGDSHDMSPQLQRGGYLANLDLTTTLRMALRRTRSPESRHILLTLPSEPNAPIPPTSGNHHPSGKEVKTCKPMGHHHDTAKGHPTHIPNQGGNIRQPPQLLHLAGHYLFHRIPRGLLLRGSPRRLQLPPNKIVYRKPGIRPRGHEESDSTRPRLIHRHNDTLLDSHGASRLGGYSLVLHYDM